MQLQYLYTYLLHQALIRMVNSQDLSGLPQCAQTPALTSISSTGCQLTDIACICKDSTFASSLGPVIKQDCSPADYQKTLVFTQQLCGSVGVTVSIDSATAPNGTPSPTASVPSTSLTLSSGTIASAYPTTSSATSSLDAASGTQSAVVPTSATSLASSLLARMGTTSFAVLIAILSV